MNQPTIVILIREVLIASGLIHLIRNKYPEAVIESYTRLSSLSHAWSETGLLILDPGVLDAPEKVSLEKLYKKNPGWKFVGISQQPIPEDQLPFFEETIRFNSSEEDIMRRLSSLLNNRNVKGDRSPAAGIISEREKEVLRGVALGMTNKEISDTLHISSHTVITHRKNISAKLGIKTIAGLAVYAILNGIIAPEEMDPN